MGSKRTVAFFLAAAVWAGIMSVSSESFFALKTEAAAAVGIDKTHFPDKAFREYIKKQFDIDKSGTLSSDEISLVTSIDLFGGFTEEVESLKGIEYFTELCYLNCTDNYIPTLDLRYNRKLVRLECSNCGMKKLNIKNNKKLKYLDIHKNNIKSLDLSNNKELTYLDCIKAGSFSLDLRNNRKLEELYLSYIGTELDLTNNPKMKILSCVEGELERIDVTNCKKLTYLDCRGQYKLSALDLTNCKKLKALYCGDTDITRLDLSNNNALEELFCDTDITIYCKEGSFAEEYAEENGIDYIIS